MRSRTTTRGTRGTRTRSDALALWTGACLLQGREGPVSTNRKEPIALLFRSDEVLLQRSSGRVLHVVRHTWGLEPLSTLIPSQPAQIMCILFVPGATSILEDQPTYGMFMSFPIKTKSLRLYI